MEFSHKPVMLAECMEALRIEPEGIYIDGTLGGAGHASEILKRLKAGGLLAGLDQDTFAVSVSQSRLESVKGEAAFILHNKNFMYIEEVCQSLGIQGVNGILLDLGVSSHQLDEPQRGFSYQHDAPLDMRMDRKQALTAETILNEYSFSEIFHIIRDYGEEKWAKRIADFIIAARRKERLKTTSGLVDIIKAAIPSSARREGPHPAKRTFQALRIAVNNELGVIEKTIDAAVRVLKPGGRLCIITFHSLEDRIVKNAYQKKANPCTCPPSFPVCICGKKPEAVIVNRKPIVPEKTELDENPRARSAKLRVLEKLP